ncbi:hypothetical protein [Granulicella sibirica]|uniref:Uncharacterized protein n=1 Tax=Granulicella sibirica TaxID=2479048 RepID=A0A4Q0T1P3_9BACT|nr:hypothetical protein [Granulicella sibirica]RXH57565.1 hypothetical protein GRAN_0875 [Granulicella sibirica]
MNELPEPELWTDEYKAQILLNAAGSIEEWDETSAEVRSWGLDPAKIPYVDPNHRGTLPTRAEMYESIRRARAELGIRRSA